MAPYLIRKPSGRRDVTLIATGSEVEVAVKAAEALAGKGLHAAVVSMPCWERFETLEPKAQREVLGEAPRIAVEAAARLGWDRWTGEGGAFVGMQSFGASAPAGDLYRHFSITPEAVAAEAVRLLEARR